MSGPCCAWCRKPIQPVDQSLPPWERAEPISVTLTAEEMETLGLKANGHDVDGQIEPSGARAFWWHSPLERSLWGRVAIYGEDIGEVRS